MRNSSYQVDAYRYETDQQGRVMRVSGDLSLASPPPTRHEAEQTESVRLKDGLRNPGFLSDPRSDDEKRKKLDSGAPNPLYREDTRTQWEQREFLDDGGHLIAAMFFGPGEQINIRCHALGTKPEPR